MKIYRIAAILGLTMWCASAIAYTMKLDGSHLAGAGLLMMVVAAFAHDEK